MALLRAHYCAGRPIAAAFAGLLAELCDDEGLLILDPRVPEVARWPRRSCAARCRSTTVSRAISSARAAALAAAGFDEQVHTRPDASLVFFHREGGPARVTGWRARVTVGETPAGAVSHAALLELLAREPLRFSHLGAAAPDRAGHAAAQLPHTWAARPS